MMRRPAPSSAWMMVFYVELVVQKFLVGGVVAGQYMAAGATKSRKPDAGGLHTAMAARQQSRAAGRVAGPVMHSIRRTCLSRFVT